MRLRTMYPGFTQAVNVYFDKLVPKLVPLQVKASDQVLTAAINAS